MSGTYPASPAPRTVSRKSFTPTLISTAHSLKRQVRQRGSQQWQFVLTYAPARRATLAPLEAFLMAQRGQYSTFQFVPPIYGKSSGTVSGTVTTTATAAIGATSVPITGLTGTLKAGDFVKFAGHTKCYMLTADATTTLTIEPPLVAALASGEGVTYDGVPVTCALASDTFEATLGPANLTAEFTVSLIEVL